MNKAKLVIIITLLCLWLLPYIVVAQPTPSGIWDMQWSPNGEQLAIADLNSNVYVLTSSNGSLKTFQGHSNRVFVVAWNPDGQILASGGFDDQFANLWDVTTEQLIGQAQVSPDAGELYEGVGGLVWSPSGDYLMATSFDTFVFWETTSWTLLEPSRQGSVMDAEWSPDGSLLAVTDIYSLAFFNGQTLLIDDLDNDVIQIVGENPEQLSWSSNSQLLATTDRRNPRVSIWDVSTRTRIGQLNTTGSLFKDVVFIGEDQVAALTETGTIYILDTSANILTTHETGIMGARVLAWNESTGAFAVGGLETIIDESGISGLPFITLDDVLSPTADVGAD